MQLPEIARRVGTIDRKQIVYIEEYVLQYLKTYVQENLLMNERIILYGKSERREGTNIYIIYAVCREGDEQDVTERKDTKEIYEKIGYLWHRPHEAVQQAINKTATEAQDKLSLSGYYVFFDVNEKMKDYLGQYYQKRLEQMKTPILQEASGQIEENILDPSAGQAELIALNHETIQRPLPLYRMIRIAVVCIVIIFCSIAVTTINAYDKMEDFVQTIMFTSEWQESQP